MKDNWFKENKIEIIYILFLFLCLAGCWILYILFGHQFIKAMYEGRSIEILNRIMERRSPHPLEFYYIFADSLLIRFSLALLLITAYIYTSKKFNLIAINPIIIFLIIFSYIYFSSYNYDSLIIKTPDSLNHISTAEHLLQNKGFYSTGPNQTLYFKFKRMGIKKDPWDIEEFHPYTHWPPLYPLLLAILMRVLNLTPLAAAVILNRIFFALTVTLIYLVLVREAPQGLRPIGAIVALGVTFFKPFIFIFSFVWAEMAYIGLSTFAVYLLHKFYNCAKEKELKVLLFSAIFASLSLLCRYPGIIVIITGLIMIILKGGQVITKRKIRNSLIFGSISFFPALPWLFRNKILTGFFIGGERIPGSGSTLAEFLSTIKVLARGFLYIDNMYIIGFLLVSLLVFTIYKRKFFLAISAKFTKKYTAFILYPFLYLLILIILTSEVYVERLDLRLIAPTYPFIIICFVLFFYQFFNNIKEGKS